MGGRGPDVDDHEVRPLRQDPDEIGPRDAHGRGCRCGGARRHGLDHDRCGTAQCPAPPADQDDSGSQRQERQHDGAHQERRQWGGLFEESALRLGLQALDVREARG